MTDTAWHSEGEDRQGPWVVTCDHATNRVPPEFGPLGLPEDEMQRHIAWDIGALGVARALGDLLDAPVVWSDFSRLVIDPNRGPDDPTLLMKLYDGTIIPGNRHADADEIARRRAALYDPYHEAVARVLRDRTEAALVSVHSFTPQLRNRPPRPWQVGILSAHDRRLADPLLDSLGAEPDLCIGDNEPYAGHLPGDAVDRHALATGRLNVLLELRQDLIATADGQRHWAERLAPHLARALADVTGET